MLRLQIDGPGGPRSYSSDLPQIAVGRAPENDIVLDDGSVSRHHARIERRDGAVVLLDLGSVNGTTVGGRVLRGEDAPLSPGITARIGPYSLRLAEQPTPSQPAPVSRSGDAARALGTVHPATATRITVGRDPANDLTLESRQVSRRHAVFERPAPDQPWTVTDLNSTNHTFVNGVAVTQQRLADGDVVRIGPYRLAVRGGAIEQHDETQGYLLEALDLTTQVGHGKVILDDVSFVARPAEFVAIVGGSGAGKTTLMGALSGLRPATRGQVLLNGFPLYAHFDAFRAQIGYVPQDDIIHRELTTEHALDYAAQLRMPADTSREERAARVREVLDELGLTPHAGTQVGRLSGGQRKRVSIGVELLTSPPLFFLDEPTSGLDPGAETRMMTLLRQLADGGRTVILITHATRNIALCDKVCFLAEGGRLAFYGRPDEALAHFGVSDFEDIYQQVEETDTPEGWAAKYRASQVCAAEITAPLAHRRAGDPPSAAMPARVKPPPAAEAWRQFRILSRRYAEIVLHDRKNLLILLIQAPVIALLLWPLLPSDVYAGGASDNGPATQAAQLASVLALTAVWLGSLNAIREISKEDAIYRRERRVNLSVVAYVGSKLVVLFALVVVQAALLLGVTAAHVAFPDVAGLAGTWLTLVLAGTASVALALAVSAAVSNPDRAVFIAPIILLPQIFFSGLIKPVDQLGGARPLAALAPARWAFEGIGRVTGVVNLALPGLPYPQRSALTGAALSRWLILLLFVAVCAPAAVGLQRLKDRR